MVASLVPVELASASRAQVHGGGPAAAGAVPAGTPGLPASLLGLGCPRHLAHQHHPCPCPLFQVGTTPCPALSFLMPFLTCSTGPTEFPATLPPTSLPTFTHTLPLEGALRGRPQ